MSYGSRGRTERTVGLDLGDKYSYLCVLDTETGKLVQDGRLRTIPDDLRRRFDSEQRMKRRHRSRYPLDLDKPAA
jgi:hypothetical protein